MAQLSHEQKMEMLFTALVEQWQAQAWIALGKVPNPATNKIERNLEFAKMAIDMLDMIKEKTSGNLTESETRMLTKVIADLKLNYVDEYEREKREKQQAEQKAQESGEKEKAEASGGSAGESNKQPKEAATAEKSEPSETASTQTNPEEKKEN